MDETPVYMRIAYDLAKRIAEGDIKEDSFISGRSLLGPAYGVSPETARRAIHLLSDTGIVVTEKNIGSRVVSRKLAVEYLEQHQSANELRMLKQELEQLQETRTEIDSKINTVLNKITELATRFQSSRDIRTYEFEVSKGRQAAGQTIGALAFREKTGATIVAVRRGDELFSSPGPGFKLAAGDVLIVACDITSVQKVGNYVG